MQYWLPNWPLGFGGNADADQATDKFGRPVGFSSGEARGGDFAFTRFNFPDGWFVGSERGGGGVVRRLQSSACPVSARSSMKARSWLRLPECDRDHLWRVQRVKYNSGIGDPFSAFDSRSSTASGYSAQVGVKFQPAPISVCRSGPATPSSRLALTATCSALRHSAFGADAPSSGNRRKLRDQPFQACIVALPAMPTARHLERPDFDRRLVGHKAEAPAIGRRHASRHRGDGIAAGNHGHRGEKRRHGGDHLALCAAALQRDVDDRARRPPPNDTSTWSRPV